MRTSKKQMAERDAKWHALVASINQALASGATLKTQTAFGEFEVASVRYGLDGMWYQTKGSYLNTRTFAIHGGHLLDWAASLGLDAR